MLRLTLDTNCLIDAEERNARGRAVLELAKLAADNSVIVQIPAISASENPRGERTTADFYGFVDRVRLAGLACASIVLPIGYWGLTFLDRALLADERMLALERQIHRVLFPSMPFDYADFCREAGLREGSPVSSKWRNAKCDVLVAWSHIFYGGDLLVTEDANFHARRRELIALGAGSIDGAAAALVLVQSTIRT